VISCKRAAELTSRELDTPLPLGTRAVLGFHRLVCAACRRFRGQLAEVDRAVAVYVTTGVAESVHLPDDVRERIVQALRDDPPAG
jgi:predicted anti-sigma-YlaC factor YlaD